VSSQFCKASQHGAIVPKELVAVQLDEFIECQVEIVFGVRAIFVPRHLHDLPGSQVAIRFASCLRPFAAQASNLLVFGLGSTIVLFQDTKLILDVENRLLEFESRWCSSHLAVCGSWFLVLGSCLVLRA
jgi:hypothetical protein